MSQKTATVIGWPIEHSRSPMIHGSWLAEYGIDGDYIIVAVPPGDVPRHFERIRAGEFVGSNVTIPHKQAAFAEVDWLDAAAEATEAVNTVWLQDGHLCGSNTDVEGFLANLDAGAPGWSADTAVVLGAGGAARGVAHALVSRGIGRVVVANRTFSRAEALAKGLGNEVRAARWADLSGVLAGADLLVNATSLGMTGQPPLQIDLAALPDRAVVNDIVYAPLETPLLAAARARGLGTVGGLGMLLHQAVPGFEKWFGIRPRVSGDLFDRVAATL